MLQKWMQMDPATINCPKIGRRSIRQVYAVQVYVVSGKIALHSLCCNTWATGFTNASQLLMHRHQHQRWNCDFAVVEHVSWKSGAELPVNSKTILKAMCTR